MRKAGLSLHVARVAIPFYLKHVEGVLAAGSPGWEYFSSSAGETSSGLDTGMLRYGEP